MVWKALCLAVGVGTLVSCTTPNPDYIMPGTDKPVPADVTDDVIPAADPDGKSRLEVFLDRGQSLGNNPSIVTGQDWPAALGSTQYTTQALEFSEKSGVAWNHDGQHILNFPGGSNLFKHTLEFTGGLDISKTSYQPATGTYVCHLNIGVNILGEDYSLEKVEFNSSTGETRIYMDSMDEPGKRMVLYDDDATSDKYSKRETEVDGTVLKNLDVKIEADLVSGTLYRIKIRNQLLPNDNINIGSCEAASGRVDPYSLLSIHFDIVHKGKKDCPDNAAYNALVADTTGF